MQGLWVGVDLVGNSWSGGSKRKVGHGDRERTGQQEAGHGAFYVSE